MELLLAAILLSAPVQQAEQAQEGWNAWRNALGTKLPTPISLDLEMDCQVSLEDFDADEAPEVAWLNGMKFMMNYRAAMLDLQRFRIEMELRGKMPDPDADVGLIDIVAQAGLTADGTTIHAWGEMNFGGTDEKNGGGARVTQTEVEALYAMIRTALPAMMEESGGLATSGLLSTVLQMYPEQFGGYFHPCNYLAQAMPMFSVREYRRADGRVHAVLGLDSDHGPVAEMIAGLETMAAESEDSEAMGIAKAMRQMMNGVDMKFEFDERTGAALSGHIEAEFSAEAFDVASKGKIGFVLNFRSSKFSTEAFSPDRLAPPTEGWNWIDGDPFIMMAKMQLQSLAGDESDGDLEF